MIVLSISLISVPYSVIIFGIFVVFFFFFKQKTAYEMRISDWSSDVCSSDLTVENPAQPWPERAGRTGWPQGARPARTARRHRLGEIGRASCRERVCQYV